MKTFVYICLLVALFSASCSNSNSRCKTTTHHNDTMQNECRIGAAKVPEVNISYTEISHSEYLSLRAVSKNEKLTTPTRDVVQTDNGLTINLKNGCKISCKNDNGIESESSIQTFEYVGYSLKHKIHVYSQKMYESTDFFLVSDQGEVYPVWWDPCFLDRGNLMFCTMGMLNIEGGSNGFQIYLINDGASKLLKEENLSDWTPSDAYWINDNELVLVKNFPYDGYKVPTAEYCKLSITFDGSTSRAKYVYEDGMTDNLMDYCSHSGIKAQSLFHWQWQAINIKL